MTPEQTAEIIALLREIRNEQRAGFIRLELAIKALAPAQPDTSHTPPADNSSPELTDLERRILEFLTERPGCIPSVIKAAAMVQSRHLHKTLNSLVERGYLTEKREGRARAFYPRETVSIDFSNIGDVGTTPRRFQGKRQCRECRGMFDYPAEFLPPDEIGYQPGHPMCRPCAQKDMDATERVLDRRARIEMARIKSHQPEELADELGVELPDAEGSESA